MDYVMHTFKCKLSCNVKLCRPQRYSTREIPNSLPGNNIKNYLFLLIVSMYQSKGMYDTTLHGMGDILRTFVVNPLEFPQQNRSFRFVLHVCEFVELLQDLMTIHSSKSTALRKAKRNLRT